MNNIDKDPVMNYHYAASHIASIGRLKNVFFVYPDCHPNYNKINLDTMFRIVAWDDEIFENYISRNYWPKDNLGCLGDRYYDVSYIKEGNMDQVTKQEWMFNIGPTNPGQFQMYYGRDPNFSRHNRTKVICLEKHSYDLKSLKTLVLEGAAKI